MFSQFSSKSLFSTSATALDYRLVFLASCLLSIWLIAIDPIINRDAIIYLHTAEAYLQDGILAGLSVYDRPLLPICFALVHKFTGIPLAYAGQIVVTLFYALLATSFVATVRVLGGDRRVQIIAAIVIISHPAINTSRAAIMRDPAYWALCMLAFRELLLFTRSTAWQHQLRWFVYIGLASLFRFEGVFFAALAPVAIFLAGEKGSRWHNSLRFALPPVMTIVGLIGLILIYEARLFPGEQLFRDIGAYIKTFLSLPGQFEQFAAGPALDWVGVHSRGDKTTAAVGGLVAILALNLFRAMIWPYVGVLIWGGANKLFDRVQPRDRILINTHLLIALLYLILFIFTKRFMLERYCGIFTLFLLLYMPFILNNMWGKREKLWGKFFVVLLLFGFSIDSLTNRDYEKAYVREATEWYVDNTPPNASMASNSSYIAYFGSGEFAWGRRHEMFKVQELSKKAGYWQEADYLVVSLETPHFAEWDKFLADNTLQELKVFSGKQHGKVVIVKIPDARDQLSAPR